MGYADVGVASSSARMNRNQARFFSLLRGGAAAPINQMYRYLSIGAAGEVKRPFARRF